MESRIQNPKENYSKERALYHTMKARVYSKDKKGESFCVDEEQW
jgi:hypothetical protein